MQPLSNKELEKFYDETNIAIFGTLKKNGGPQMTPVWFFFDKGVFYLTTGEGRAKANNIQRDPNATLLIGSKDFSKVVVVYGKAEVFEDHGNQRTKFLAERYIPDPQSRETALKWILSMKRLTIKITPEKTISWDQKK